MKLILISVHVTTPDLTVAQGERFINQCAECGRMANSWQFACRFSFLDEKCSGLKSLCLSMTMLAEIVLYGMQSVGASA